MLYSLVQAKKNRWLASNECTVKGLLAYIRGRGDLRDAQIEAIETYLFLKLVGGNKPLAQLFAEGFFFDSIDLDALQLNVATRELLANHVAARSLFQFARLRNGNGALLPELEQAILTHADALDYQAIIKSIFYNIDYADYLFSLPMGAGKTFLIAALIYLDLYFAETEPDNPLFAHNFLVLVPSGLKSSIVPSLKTIERFDPTWVLPDPAASNLKRMIQFAVLDQPKSAKKSNRARNPNSQKVSAAQSVPDTMGWVFVVNAEKVILEKVELDAQQELIQRTDDERAKNANELRLLLGKLPNLAIHIDEVHHATSEDIKLRQVVNQWNREGKVVGVMGYSGTPYLSAPEPITAGDFQMRFKQITNTVYYYPLVTAIKRFLKQPRIGIAEDLAPLEIIRKGVEDFRAHYANKVYADGTIAKLAIYCGTIERLEQEIYPFLTNELGIPEEEILRYHKGNKQFPTSRAAETEFATLDTSLSRKRYILLVQIGKEGWDCRSLTSVILAQKGDSPTNMVLQTSCRCLRQVDKGQAETALIWLNEDNAKTLNKQLKEEQNTSIADINALTRDGANQVQRVSRIEFLKLPPVEFYQLKIEYETLFVAPNADTANRLNALRDNLAKFKTNALVTQAVLNGETTATVTSQRTDIISTVIGSRARFDVWLAEISKASFNTLSYQELNAHRATLEAVFDAITFDTNGARHFNALYDTEAIQSQIRLAFSLQRKLDTRREEIPQSAHLVIAAKLTPIAKNPKLYPDSETVKDILQADATNQTADQLQAARIQAREMLRAQFGEAMAQSIATTLPPALAHKDHTLHYLPYDFASSGFELQFLETVLGLGVFQDKRLELYYNGARGLTDFVIQCYAQTNGGWNRIGKYTPDFLILQRTAPETIHKVLIVETKGSGFAEQKEFQARKKFVETEFLLLNRARFGYQKFEYLFIRDDAALAAQLAALTDKMNAFF